MTIIEALLDRENNVRVVCGDRWLAAHTDHEGRCFTVYEQRPRQKHERCLVATEVEDESVRYLIGEK